MIETLIVRVAGAIKPLPWEQNWHDEPQSQWALVREIGRSYTVDPISNVFKTTTREFPTGDYSSDTDLGLHPTFESAKAAAQSDFEQRIGAWLA